MDNTLDLYKYFAQFVPVDVLKKSLVQPDTSSAAGYEEIAQEVINQQSDNRIAELQQYVFSADPAFVFDKLTNTNEIFLFVEYGNADLDKIYITQMLAINVITETNKSNMDNLNEVILINKCKNILQYILEKLQSDIEDNCFCSEIVGAIELVPRIPNELKDWSGWCAFIDLKTMTSKIIL